MNHFELVDGALHCEGVPLARIAAEVGTPTYVYSTATLLRHLTVVQDAFASTPTLVCYSVKASSNLALLKLLAKNGAGFDIVSGGELERVRRVGADLRKVVFAGVGKTDEEMVSALKAGILMFNVESAEELERLAHLGRSTGIDAPFAIRVNPDVDAKTHKYIATGLKSSKFGVPVDEAVALYAKAKRLGGLVARGLDCHIGSQLTDTKPVREAMKRVGEVFQALKTKGVPLTHLDVGGGLGVTYTKETPPPVADYATAVLEPLRHLGATLVLEPGRVLVANAGVLLTKVLYRKRTSEKFFVIVDAGMNDLLRPALYEAHHDIRPVSPRKGKKRTVEIVGPVCESSDVLGHERVLAPTEQGDLLAVMTAGAYGMSMSSTYNSRRRPAEVLVDGNRFRVVRARDTLTDVMRGETP